MTLFSFQSFAGSLAPDRIAVTGVDPARIDLSHVLQDGSIGVTAAVPEPGTWAMLLCGLGLVGWAGRPRRGV